MEFKTLQRFINEYKIGWTESTTMAYESDIRLFLENVQLKKNINDEILFLQGITNDDYEDWKSETEGVYALTTLNRKITALSLFFKYTTINKKITINNPMDGVGLVKINEKKESPWKKVSEKDILTKEELLKMIEYSYKKDIWEREFELCSSRDRFLLAFEATTGVRISEAIDITFDMIEEVKDGYMVNINVTKTNQNKRIPIANKCLRYYEEYLEYREHFQKAKDCNHLIVSSRGKKMSQNSCNRGLEKLLRKANIEDKHITSHCNRHMFRTYATAEGIQENLIKLIGGWVLDKVASIYIKDGVELDMAKIKACNLI